MSDETDLEVRGPGQAVSPGRILRRELDARGWSQKDLSRIMGRPVQAINEIASGQKAITADTALQLGAAFGVSPQFWLDLEANYRLHLAKQPKPEIAIRRNLFSLAPISELQHRGWISATNATEELASSLCEFLQIPSLDSTPPFPVASLRVTAGSTPQRANLGAWLMRAQSLARQENVSGSFDPDRIEGLVSVLRGLSTGSEGVREVPRVLGEHGIRFVLIPHLPKTYLDGVQFRAAEQPVIGLTTRLDRIDNWWFVLFHELAHLRHGDDGTMDENPSTKDPDDVERRRSEQAADWLISPDQMKVFLDAFPAPSWPDIVEGARVMGIHSSILLGRLQYDKKVGWDKFRAGLPKVRPFVEDWFDKPIAV